MGDARFLPIAAFAASLDDDDVTRLDLAVEGHQPDGLDDAGSAAHLEEALRIEDGESDVLVEMRAQHVEGHDRRRSSRTVFRDVTRVLVLSESQAGRQHFLQLNFNFGGRAELAVRDGHVQIVEIVVGQSVGVGNADPASAPVDGKLVGPISARDVVSESRVDVDIRVFSPDAQDGHACESGQEHRGAVWQLAREFRRRVVHVGDNDADTGHLIRVAPRAAMVRHLYSELDASQLLPIQWRQRPDGASVGVDGKQLGRSRLHNVVRQERIHSGVAIFGRHDQRSGRQPLED